MNLDRQNGNIFKIDSKNPRQNINEWTNHKVTFDTMRKQILIFECSRHCFWNKDNVIPYISISLVYIDYKEIETYGMNLSQICIIMHIYFII